MLCRFDSSEIQRGGLGRSVSDWALKASCRLNTTGMGPGTFNQRGVSLSSPDSYPADGDHLTWNEERGIIIPFLPLDLTVVMNAAANPTTAA
jgi:hypothetical protein